MTYHLSIDIGNSHDFPIDFNTQFLSFILPNWPLDFKIKFLDYFKELLDQFIPAHINFIYRFNQLVVFEDTYMKLLESKMESNNDNSDIMSMQLIQLLKLQIFSLKWLQRLGYKNLLLNSNIRGIV